MTKSKTKSLDTGRAERGRRIASKPGAVRRLTKEVYAVAGDSGAIYLVRRDEETCECKDFEFHGSNACKHLVAVEVYVAALRASRASRAFRTSRARTSEPLRVENSGDGGDGYEAGTARELARELARRKQEESFEQGRRLLRMFESESGAKTIERMVG